MATSEIRPGIRLLTLAGELDLSDVQSTINEFKELEAFRVAIVDLSATKYMDSTVLGLLVHLHQRRLKKEQRLFFVRPNADLQKIFRIAGLDRILTLYDSLEEATKGAAKAL